MNKLPLFIQINREGIIGKGNWAKKDMEEAGLLEDCSENNAESSLARTNEQSV